MDFFRKVLPPVRDMCTDPDRFVFWSFCKVRVLASPVGQTPDVTRQDPKVQICSKTPNYVHMSHFKVWIGTHAVAPPLAVTLPTDATRMPHLTASIDGKRNPAEQVTGYRRKAQLYDEFDGSEPHCICIDAVLYYHQRNIFCRPRMQG
jgi:hypothetical protein